MELSVIVLTQNSQDVIENCIQSVRGWAKEIIVVDGGSQDKTLEIVSGKPVSLYHHPWEGFSLQRNYAMTKVSTEWALYVDSDERVSKELRHEIDALQPPADTGAYRVRRENIILGKILKKGGWYPDYQIRLLNKHMFEEWEGDLHEHPVFKGSQVDLQSTLIHLTHRNINWKLSKTIQYTDETSKLLHAAKHPKIGRRHLVAGALREFWQRGVMQRGLSEGMEGFINTIYQTFDAFVMYTKVWELQNGITGREDFYRQIDIKLKKDGRY